MLDRSKVRPVMHAWAVINTHVHRERFAVENLDRQGFEVYCPSVMRRIRHARRMRDVTRPMFPGYVFVRVEVGRTLWRPLLSTFGVRSVVRCGDQISLLDEDFIVALRAREVDGYVTKPTTPYRVGQDVRIAGGPFDGLVAKIVEMSEKNRLVVLMNLLNNSVRVKIDADGVAELA